MFFLHFSFSSHVQNFFIENLGSGLPGKGALLTLYGWFCFVQNSHTLRRVLFFSVIFPFFFFPAASSHSTSTSPPPRLSQTNEPLPHTPQRPRNFPGSSPQGKNPTLHYTTSSSASSSSSSASKFHNQTPSTTLKKRS